MVVVKGSALGFGKCGERRNVRSGGLEGAEDVLGKRNGIERKVGLEEKVGDTK